MRRVAGPVSTAVGAIVAVAVLAGCGSDGGDRDVAEATTTTAAAATSGAGDSFAVLAGEGVPVDLDELAANLRDRLIAADHLEATVEVDGDRVQVSPGPGPLDAAELDDLLSTPGRLEMRPVLAVLPPDCEVVEPTGTPEVAVYPELDADGAVTACYSLAPSGLTNDAIEDASATIPNDAWVVNPILTETGIAAFNALAADCVDTAPSCPTGMVAIALDGVVLTAPSIEQPVFQRDLIQISGGGGQDPASATFTEAEARALAAALRVEPLPSGLEVVR